MYALARSVIAFIAFGILSVPPAFAGVCGQPISSGTQPTATDALYILRSSVGTALCTLSACDTSADCALTATDALRAIRAAVGRSVTLDCRASCLTDVPCADAGAAICNGICPPGFACTASDAGLTKPDQRVTVCHVTDSGFETRTVDPSELEKHLNHGDSLDACVSSVAAVHGAASIGDIAGTDSAAASERVDTGADGAVSAALEASLCGCQPLEISTLSTTTTLFDGTTTTTTTSTSTTNTLPLPPTDDGDNDGLSDSDDPCPFDPRNRCSGPLAVDTVSGVPLRINANASAYDECAGARIDCAGDTWYPDFGYSSPFTSSKCDIVDEDGDCTIRGLETVFGCADAATEDLLQCEHFDRAPLPELGYRFNVPNGTYIVNLLFANTFKRTRIAGRRIFDIAIEGEVVYPAFDQIAVAGGSRVAVVRAAVVTVADGNGLQIEFGHIVENPAVKAIEVYTLAGL